MERDELKEKRNARSNSGASQRSSSPMARQEKLRLLSEKKKNVFVLEYVDIVYDFEKEMLMHSTDFSKTNLASFNKDQDRLDVLKGAFDSEMLDQTTCLNRDEFDDMSNLDSKYGFGFSK